MTALLSKSNNVLALAEIAFIYIGRKKEKLKVQQGKTLCGHSCQTSTVYSGSVSLAKCLPQIPQFISLLPPKQFFHLLKINFCNGSLF